LGAGLAALQSGAAATRHQPAGEVESLFLDADALLRDGELAPGAARVGIGTGGLGGDGDPAQVEGRLDRLDVRPARLGGAADPPEQVELIADVEAAAEGRTQILTGGLAAGEGRGRKPGASCLAEHRPGAL